MTRLKKQNLYLLLVIAVLVSACELDGRAQEKKEAELKQAVLSMKPTPEKQKTLESRAKEWLDYEPTVVRLKGKLLVKTFFGPPNFGENPKTDSKERSWILSLDKPINVRAITETDPILGPSVENVRELQLVLSKPHRELIGKEVFVEGTLFHAHNGHHHTDVLMKVQSISRNENDVNKH